MSTMDYDVVVIGSGFGGSVAALRLTEKGYRVAVLEAGRRWDANDFPKTNWRLSKYLWLPRLGLYGLQRITVLPHVVSMSGSGVGGGSLVYANVLLRPHDAFFDSPQWAGITDWRAELAPFYRTAEQMLGAATSSRLTAADQVLKDVAGLMGCQETWRQTPVAVYFGEPGKTVPDPFFGGRGPARTGCISCGSCTTGCRHGAKNTLPMNYLFLAERNGATIFPLTEVISVRSANDGTYVIEARKPGTWFGKQRRTFTAQQVIFAAGTFGTQKLLHALRDQGALPRISPRLGALTRTNSEAGSAMTAARLPADYNTGPTITSMINPEPHTTLELVRFGKGSNLMGLATTLMSPGGRTPRLLRFLATALRHPVQLWRAMSVRKWSDRCFNMLAMQSLDNSLELFSKRGLSGRRLSSRQGPVPNPNWIPVAHKATRIAASKMDAVPGMLLTEAFNIPATAHLLGGCVIGHSSSTGVVDQWQRLYGHPGLHIMDGSVVPANPGTNPALTITAMTERAMAYWPRRGELDRRPSIEPLSNSVQ